MSEYSDNNYISSLTPRIDVFGIVKKDGVKTGYTHTENILH